MHLSPPVIPQGNRPALAQERSVPSGITKHHIHTDKDNGNTAQHSKAHEGHAPASLRRDSDLDSAFRRSTSNKSSLNSSPADGSSNSRCPHGPFQTAASRRSKRSPRTAPSCSARGRGRQSTAAAASRPGATVSLASRSRTPHASPQQQQPLAAQRRSRTGLLGQNCS